VVAVEDRKADWLVTVTDNALGIAKEHREVVLSMFTRVSGDSVGHGIGLAACGRSWSATAAGSGSRQARPAAAGSASLSPR
jgi:K+-sensing histidine kinase KdpD